MACTPRTHNFGPNVRWDQSLVMPNLAANGTNELFFASRRRYARNEFLRLTHDGTDWREEYLRDPVTCDPAGPGLLTPLDSAELGPTSFHASSPRHILKTTTDGVSWSVPDLDTYNSPNFDGHHDLGPEIAQSPSNPAVIYLQDAYGVFRTTDGGASYRRMFREEQHEAQQACAVGKPLSASANGPGCVDEFIQAPWGHGDKCGRNTVMCPFITQLIVDVQDPDRLLAATEKGVWAWRYPYDGTGLPRIADHCLTHEAQALSGATWTLLQGACPPGQPCLREGFLQAIAQHLTIPDRLFAGGLDGLYRSLDGGQTWTRDATIPGATAIQAIVTLPAPKQNLVLVATNAGGFLSADDGDTFAPTDLTLPAQDVTAWVPPSGPATIYAAVMDWNPATLVDGIYKSAAEGASGTWVKLIGTLDNQRFLSVFAATSGTVFAGLLGDGVVRVEAETASCERLATANAAPTAGETGLGASLTALGDVLDLVGKSYCQPRVGALEFAAGPQAAIRILRESGFNFLPRVVSARALAYAEGTLQGLGDVDSPPDTCPDVALGLRQPAPSGSAGVVELWSLCANPAPAVIHTLQPGDLLFGHSMARSGNILAVGAPSHTNPRVYPYCLDSLPNPFAVVPAPLGAPLRFGWSVGLADMDGNGSLDLAVGAVEVSVDGQQVGTGAGNVYLHSGVDAWTLPQPPVRTLTGSPGSLFGFSLGTGLDRKGDLTSMSPDGRADLLIGAPKDFATGRAFWYGHMQDLGPVVLSGEVSGDRFGHTVPLAEDVTADDLPDALVAAPWNTKAPRTQQGTVYVFDGTGGPPCDELRGDVDFGLYGWSMARAGDVDKNRDGNNTMTSWFVDGSGIPESWGLWEPATGFAHDARDLWVHSPGGMMPPGPPWQGVVFPYIDSIADAARAIDPPGAEFNGLAYDCVTFGKPVMWVGENGACTIAAYEIATQAPCITKDGPRILSRRFDRARRSDFIPYLPLTSQTTERFFAAPSPIDQLDPQQNLLDEPMFPLILYRLVGPNDAPVPTQLKLTKHYPRMTIRLRE